ncbi:hypothetical protein GQ53DRAFT_83786 [Thozetella sp. PMI_491]|nr:hypothetical protein GQ53DRAFT_83786 [Thozetella sp. PMI_491]
MPPAAAEAPRKRKQRGRSRAGCLTCRKRHVRCDERRPVCNTCEVRSRACEYSDATLTLGERRWMERSIAGIQEPWRINEPIQVAVASSKSDSSPSQNSEMSNRMSFEGDDSQSCIRPTGRSSADKDSSATLISMAAPFIDNWLSVLPALNGFSPRNRSLGYRGAT